MIVDLEGQPFQRRVFIFLAITGVDMGSPTAFVGGFQLAMEVAMNHPEWLAALHRAVYSETDEPVSNMTEAAKEIASRLVEEFPAEE